MTKEEFDQMNYLEGMEKDSLSKDELIQLSNLHILHIRDLTSEVLRTEEDAKKGNDIIEFKCKPCWNYQSIEFSVFKKPAELSYVIYLYSKVLDELKEISPEQPKTVQKVAAVPLATPMQKEIMNKYGIKYGVNTTKVEAQKLIQESMNK